MRRFAWVVVALTLLALAAAGVYAVRSVAIDTNTVDMLSAELPFRKADRAMAAAFPQGVDAIVVVIDAATPERAEAAGEALAEGFRARPEVFGPVFDPAGDPFFRRNGLLFLEPDQLAGVADQLAAAQPFIASLAADPSLRGLFNVLSLAIENVGAAGAAAMPIASALDAMAAAVEAQAAGRPAPLSWQALMFGAEPDPQQLRRIIVLNPPLNYASLQPAADAIAAIRALADDLHLGEDSGVKVRLTGDAALADEELRSADLDGITPMLISFGLVALLAFICFRGVTLSLATLGTVLVGVVFTAAAAIALVGTLNLLSVAFFVLFIGLAVDFGIHYTLRYKEGLDLGLEHAPALSRAATGVGGALALSALCAAIGFFSFLPTDYVGLAELGLIAGAGMAIALVLSLSVLPAFLSLAPGSPRPEDAGEFQHNVLDRLRAWAERRPKPILAAAAAVAGVALAVAPGAHFDFDPLHLKDRDAELVATLYDLMDSGLNEAYAVAALAPDLAAADAIAERARALPEVAEARTLASFVPEAQEEKLAIIDGLALMLEPSLATRGRSPAVRGRDPRRPGPAAGRRSRRLPPASMPAAPAAGRLRAALDRVGAKGSEQEGLAGLEQALLTGLPQQLESLRTLLKAGPVGLDDLPQDLRSRWIAADGRARVAIYPARAGRRGHRRAEPVRRRGADGGPGGHRRAGDHRRGRAGGGGGVSRSRGPGRRRHRPAAGGPASQRPRHRPGVRAAAARRALDGGGVGRFRHAVQLRQRHRPAAAVRARGRRQPQPGHPRAAGGRGGRDDELVHAARRHLQRADHRRLVRDAGALRPPRHRRHGPAASDRDRVDAGVDGHRAAGADDGVSPAPGLNRPPRRRGGAALRQPARRARTAARHPACAPAAAPRR